MLNQHMFEFRRLLLVVSDRRTANCPW